MVNCLAYQSIWWDVHGKYNITGHYDDPNCEDQRHLPGLLQVVSRCAHRVGVPPRSKLWTAQNVLPCALRKLLHFRQILCCRNKDSTAKNALAEWWSIVIEKWDNMIVCNSVGLCKFSCLYWEFEYLLWSMYSVPKMVLKLKCFESGFNRSHRSSISNVLASAVHILKLERYRED